MPFPKQRDVELPLLRTLLGLGGSAAPKDVYSRVAQAFPDLTPEEQQELLSTGPVRWWNEVQWVRQRLVEKGELDGSTRGIWKLTDKGRARAQGGNGPTPPAEMSLRDQVNANLDEVRSRLLAELKALDPKLFEHFCGVFLRALGYQKVVVTGRTGDGGIDGHGDFRQGAVSIKSAFQAKRFIDTPVGRPEIDRFRGAITGEFDHGVFLTTSRFTEGAIGAAVKRGAISLLLLDGPAIAKEMIDRGIGVTRQPVYLLDLDPEFFNFSEH